MQTIIVIVILCACVAYTARRIYRRFTVSDDTCDSCHAHENCPSHEGCQMHCAGCPFAQQTQHGR